MTNGIIDSYQIRFGRFNATSEDIFRDIKYRTINISDVMYETDTILVEVFERLQEFIEYGFQVQAVTVAPGPFTDLATNTTFQACMLYLH